MEDAQMRDELDSLEFSTRTTNCLRMAGYTTIERIRKLSRYEVRALPNAGQKTWNEIAEWQNHMNGPRYEMADLVIAVRKVNEIRRYLAGNEMIPSTRLALIDGSLELWMAVE
jgi:hypothetical protein